MIYCLLIYKCFCPAFGLLKIKIKEFPICKKFAFHLYIITFIYEKS